MSEYNVFENEYFRNRRKDFEEQIGEPMPRKYTVEYSQFRGWWVIKCEGRAHAVRETRAAAYDYAGKLNFIAEGRK